MICILVCLSYEECNKRREHEEKGNHDAGVEECFLKPALGVKTGAEVVAERASKTRRGLLKQDGGNEQDRQPDLDVGQYRSESLHYGEDSSISF